jgi:hypothetical protein
LFREEARPSAWRLCDTESARLYFGRDACQDGEAVLLCATAGPTDLAACDRNLVTSATTAEGGRPLPNELAEKWNRMRAGRESQRAPDFQVSATPSRQVAIYERVLTAVREAGGTACAYLSRFDTDGAVLFFLIDAPDRAACMLKAESAAQGAGGVPLGGQSAAWFPYFQALKRELDPENIMNPDAPLCRPPGAARA